jgi:hypothetical protein
MQAGDEQCQAARREMGLPELLPVDFAKAQHSEGANDAARGA